MERKHEKYERLIARCTSLAPARAAVAHPCDESSLRAARVPIILTSRADSVMTRPASCAVAALVANARRANVAKAVV
jgi:hypothetical protein